MPEEVIKAMRDAAGSYVDMHELHERVGSELALLTNNEDAYVTPGCAAGIVLAVLACRTRGELGQIGTLTTGRQWRDEVIIHAAHRIPYDAALRLAQVRVRQIGNAIQTWDWELEAAISERTVAVFWVAGPHLARGALSLPEVVRIAHARGVPVIVDAAAQLPPLRNLWRFTTEEGADLALFSGGKALRGPQSSGLMVGSKKWVQAARANGSPNQHLARAMKVGKEEIGGLLAAVRRYVTLDHGQLSQDWYEICSHWVEKLNQIDGLTAVLEATNSSGQPVPRVRIVPSIAEEGTASPSIANALRLGNPPIAVLPGPGDSFYIGPDCLQPGEHLIVLERVSEVLRESCPGGQVGRGRCS
jgi:uncharacterized pyridoxal phosphate-dependent enzyme